MPIRHCGCVNEYQDRKHGKGMRVTNAVNKSNSGEERCTACGGSFFPSGGGIKAKSAGKVQAKKK